MKKKQKVTLRQTLKLFLIFFVVSFFLLITFFASELKQIIVGGQLYNQIIQSKELIADVLPPPLFAIESYMNDIEMVQEKNKIIQEDLFSQSKKMELEYEEKLASWRSKYSSNSHIIQLLENSASTAHEIFRLQKNELIPFLRRNDIKSALKLAQGRLRNHYQIHRDQVEKIVDVASLNNKIIEANSKKIIERALWAMIIFSCFFLTILSVIFFWIIRIETKSRAISVQNIELKNAQNDLIQKTRELLMANKELQSFSYTVSHDLRGPLRGINGWTAILLEDYGDKLDEQGKGYLQKVIFESVRMGNLIDDLLKLAQISRTELSISKIDLTKLAKEIAKRLTEENPLRKIEIIIDDNMFIDGDYHLIDIAIENLFSNALKFTSKQEAPFIHFGKITGNNGDVFFIKDNGIGFNQNAATNLFKPFYRMHKQMDFPGTGIGLATVKKIFDLHNGKIWAESELNKGTIFYFQLH